MGYSAANTGATERIQLSDPNYWAEIRTCMTRGALAKAEAALSRTSVTQGGAENDAVVAMAPSIADYRNLMVLGSITAWNLDSDRGEILPVTMENVELLTGEDFGLIYGRVDALNSPLKGDDAKRFPGQGAGSDLP